VLIDTGRARIGIAFDATRDWARCRFDLAPDDPQACHVTVQPDHAEQVSLFLGPAGLTATLEIWDDDRAVLLDQLRTLLTAVVEGRYEQRVKSDRAEGSAHQRGGFVRSR
jgi:hypothetical protein